MSLAVVILAAGQGTRMKSDLPKVLHPVGGKPMVVRAVETARCVTNTLPVIVIGHGAEAVQQTIGEHARFVLQAEQLGTGHAVLQARETLRNQADLVAVFYADMPLLTAETLQRLIETQRTTQSAVTLLTVTAHDPRGFGRIVRGADGSVTGIVEERDATPEQKQIRELNAGVYIFEAAWLWNTLPKLTPKAKGEYYLTDLVQIAATDGLPVVGVESDDLDEVIGVNTRVHLSEAEAALRRRVNNRWMLEGVTIYDPARTYIHENAVIGRDTVIFPNTCIWGESVIGANCVIGPNSMIQDSTVGASCIVKGSVVEGAVMEDHVEIGPYAHLRKGAYLSRGVHMGNFGEVKNARLGPNTRMGHFSYIGDAEIGEDVNIGAGTITANFDGTKKHKTVIGDHVFIGSDTILRAPVTIEQNAKTAAGSVVTHDVPEGYISIGVPGRLKKLDPPDNA